MKVNDATPRPTSRLAPTLGAVATVMVTVLVLDLAWLGVVARDLYDSALGPLRRPDVYWPAGIMFYAMYVGVIVVHAVSRAADVRGAARRGAGLGFVAYATYELTNWAVLRDWPAILVGVDIVWGVVLTAVAAAAGRAAQEWLEVREA